MVEAQDPLRYVSSNLISFQNKMSAGKTLKAIIHVKITDHFGGIEYTQFLDYPTYRAIHLAHFYLISITSTKTIDRSRDIFPRKHLYASSMLHSLRILGVSPILARQTRPSHQLQIGHYFLKQKKLNW
jgi:hypothetical protein